MYRVKNLEKSFGENQVLKKINFEVEANEKIVIIGPSGGGKSTLLRCLNLLEEPTGGTIYYHDMKLNRRNYKKIQGKIGMVFQSFQLFDNMTVIENITLAPILNKLMPKDQAYREAREYLKQIHLEDKENVYPSSLSGGQKQRVAIVRTLLMNPEVILFDEPTSALDPEMIEEVLNLIMEVSKKNITMIVVTHELNFAKNFATRVLFMEGGTIVEDGPVKEVFEHPKTERLQQFLNIIK
ncbi:MAG TPA: amino acid ABC transporter ATP-binding protein [Candidatus Fimihabitans intestinipullorum]|uniref:Amino acid ABC transporter ATP-binding protein n=1 Tax=Candidatus Fimihabitans intestinipullorum TaxID=2840820 RepID=A0A9D1HUB8_9BACT|nr:amino acid ABC transporter ATP-binding protein [Candidatus Fimihabitans intestinipullorum]